MAYPNVNITNSTEYSAKGEVAYVVCKHDDYNVGANGSTWTASSRGVCLVKKITATLVVDGRMIDAKPYLSSGTSYSKFFIVQVDFKKGKESFIVTRNTSNKEGLDPDTGEIQEEGDDNNRD